MNALEVVLILISGNPVRMVNQSERIDQKGLSRMPNRETRLPC